MYGLGGHGSVTEDNEQQFNILKLIWFRGR